MRAVASRNARRRLRPDYRTFFEEGVAHFNAREFWHAHESWETLWLEAESDIVEFLQGMIQLAAAYHHLQRGTPRGAVRLIDAALRRLEPFPTAFSGIDRSDAVEAAIRHRAWAAAAVARGENDARLDANELPRLGAHDSATPPREAW